MLGVLMQIWHRIYFLRSLEHSGRYDIGKIISQYHVNIEMRDTKDGSQSNMKALEEGPEKVLSPELSFGKWVWVNQKKNMKDAF